MVLSVSNQGNYIQSNADRSPLAGACEQAAHSALINGRHLQALHRFVTRKKMRADVQAKQRSRGTKSASATKTCSHPLNEATGHTITTVLLS